MRYEYVHLNDISDLLCSGCVTSYTFEVGVDHMLSMKVFQTLCHVKRLRVGRNVSFCPNIINISFLLPAKRNHSQELCQTGNPTSFRCASKGTLDRVSLAFGPDERHQKKARHSGEIIVAI